MIRYNLRCDRAHVFESWFQSAAAFDSQRKRKLVNCPACGSAKVEKAIMAPQIARRSKGQDANGQDLKGPVSTGPHTESTHTDSASATAVAAETPAAATPATPLMLAHERQLRAKLRELRDHVTKNADNVGERFPNEARKMHYGDIEHRPIYGEASPDEARAMIEEGIAVSPLPILPSDRN